jgi:acetolactate synthase I/II/III large subunit
LKTSNYIASYLATQGISHVFEVVGGMISHLIDSIASQPAPQLVSMHHEQAAAFAADAMARITGKPGIALATSGPGAINLLTGVGSSYFDSSPTVFITGQVNRSEKKGELMIRQLGFQEADIVAISRPLTKGSWSVDLSSDVPDLLTKAFSLSLSGRPGPVLLDIPMDVQREPLNVGDPSPLPPLEKMPVDEDMVRAMLTDLCQAKRPLILAGGGIRSARAMQLFREFVNMVQVPVVNSLMAVDCLPSQNPLRIGLIGSYGNRWANISIAEADLLLVLGSRLDIRQTGADTKFFKGDRIIYQVDCEAGEVNNRVQGCKAILGHLSSFFEAAIKLGEEIVWPTRGSWLAEIVSLRERFPDTAELAGIPGINPNCFMKELGASSNDAQAFVADVGQHQMWAAQSLPIGEHQNFITSGGMGAMGFGLPAAIGACLALKKQPVVVIAGDGGFQLNIQELQTIKRHQLPIKMVILNNQCHGMVRQFQESYFEGRYASTLWGYSAPDFSEVAKGYGIDAHTIEAAEGVSVGLQKLWKDPLAPALLQVMIDQKANAYPKIAFGHPLTEMEPLSKPLAMEAT